MPPVVLLRSFTIWRRFTDPHTEHRLRRLCTHLILGCEGEEGKLPLCISLADCDSMSRLLASLTLPQKRHKQVSGPSLGTGLEVSLSAPNL